MSKEDNNNNNQEAKFELNFDNNNSNNLENISFLNPLEKLNR